MPRKSKFGLAGTTTAIIIVTSLIVAGGIGVAIAAGVGAFSPSVPPRSSATNDWRDEVRDALLIPPSSSAPSGAQMFSGTTCPTGWYFNPERELCVTPSVTNVSYLDRIDPETGDIFDQPVPGKIPENLVNSCVNVGGTLSPGNGFTHAPKCEQPGTLCGSTKFPDPRHVGEGRICLEKARPAQIAARSDQSSTE